MLQIQAHTEDLSVTGAVSGKLHSKLRSLLAPRVYTLPIVRSIGRTMVQGKNYGPQITVKRLATRQVYIDSEKQYI